MFGHSNPNQQPVPGTGFFEKAKRLLGKRAVHSSTSNPTNPHVHSVSSDAMASYKTRSAESVTGGRHEGAAEVEAAIAAQNDRIVAQKRLQREQADAQLQQETEGKAKLIEAMGKAAAAAALQAEAVKAAEAQQAASQAQAAKLVAEQMAAQTAATQALEDTVGKVADAIRAAVAHVQSKSDQEHSGNTTEQDSTYTEEQQPAVNPNLPMLEGKVREV